MKAKARSRSSSSPRKWLVVSVLVNIFSFVVIAFWLAAPYWMGSRLDFALYNDAHKRLCEVNYDEHLASLEREEDKRLFAALTCGVNYKTGEELDFKPVVDQIE